MAAGDTQELFDDAHYDKLWPEYLVPTNLHWDKPLMSSLVQTAGAHDFSKGPPMGMWKSRAEAVAHKDIEYVGWPENKLMPFDVHPRAVRAAAPTEKGARGNVAVVNPNVSIHKVQRHVVDARKMMDAQSRDGDKLVADSCGFKACYVYFGQVTAEEVVGYWYWEEIADNERWYEDIVMPAFRKHDRRFWAAKKAEAKKTLKKAMQDPDLDPVMLEKIKAQEAAAKGSFYSRLGRFIKGLFVSHKVEVVTEKC